MKYIMRKPEPPPGYRMLIEGQDFTTARDLIWITEDKLKHRWVTSIKQTPAGIALASDTGQLYKEPKSVEDYCFFRCRKLGNERR